MLVSFPGLKTVQYGASRLPGRPFRSRTQALMVRACNAKCNVVSVQSEREVKL